MKFVCLNVFIHEPYSIRNATEVSIFKQTEEKLE